MIVVMYPEAVYSTKKSSKVPYRQQETEGVRVDDGGVGERPGMKAATRDKYKDLQSTSLLFTSIKIHSFDVGQKHTWHSAQRKRSKRTNREVQNSFFLFYSGRRGAVLKKTSDTMLPQKI